MLQVPRRIRSLTAKDRKCTKMKRVSLYFAALLIICISSTIPSDASVKKTQTALVNCNDTSIFENDEERAGFPGIKYTWTLGGKPVQEIDTLTDRITVSAFGDLLISRFTNKDYGMYTCEIDVNASGIRVNDVVQKNVNEEYVISDIQCSLHACIAANKCYTTSLPSICSGNGEICCSNIQESDKHHCHHFLGECMGYCNQDVQVFRADDCGNEDKCCVLLATAK